MKVDILFTAGHNIVGDIVEVITQSRWAHAAIFMLDGIIEAVQPSVTVSDIHKYDDVEKEIITIEVPLYDHAVSKANSLLGIKYGLLTDCLVGGIHDVLGIELAGNGEQTLDCSETILRILRAGGVSILTDHNADIITPEDLYQAVLQVREQQIADGILVV